MWGKMGERNRGHEGLFSLKLGIRFIMIPLWIIYSFDWPYCQEKCLASYFTLACCFEFSFPLQPPCRGWVGGWACTCTLLCLVCLEVYHVAAAATPAAESTAKGGSNEQTEARAALAGKKKMLCCKGETPPMLDGNSIFTAFVAKEVHMLMQGRVLESAHKLWHC